MTDHVKVDSLRVQAVDNQGIEKIIVNDVSFIVRTGEVLALIGESGSGKTTIALALMGYARSGCGICGGSIALGDTDILGISQEELVELRGRRVSYVAQSAAAAFNPSRTIMDQVIEPALIHKTMPRKEAEARAVELFQALSLPDAENIGSRYPHQVSGGQLQRLMAAMALITGPELVIFDEPTTALDVTTQIDVLRAFKQVIRERGITAVYVSHDLAVVAQMADQVVVLNGGEIRESGSCEQVLKNPQDAYTRALMDAAKPRAREKVPSPDKSTPLLEVRGITAGYGKISSDGEPEIAILKEIDFTLERGSTLGVIGESGSGKSTLARVIAGLLPPAQGSVLLGGEPLPGALSARTKEQFRRVQIVFQNADTALNPSHTVGRILARPLRFYHGHERAALKKRVAELLNLVSLPPDIADRRCGNLSGGQKQRVNLARALAAEPDLILCDEVTSALDTVVGAAILDLMSKLREELNVSYLFISHDISTVRSVCEDILVLYSGEQVEYGTRQNFAQPPYHPYTDLLIDSVPELEIGWLDRAGHRELTAPSIQLGDPTTQLCSFLDRCPVRIDGTCNRTPAPVVQLPEGNRVRCHHSHDVLNMLAASSSKI